MEENQQKPFKPESSFAGEPAASSAPLQALASAGGKKTALAAAVFLILAVGAWFAHASINSPARVWQKFIPRERPKVFSQTYDFAYKDNGKFTGEAASSPMAGMFSNLKFSAGGMAYLNARDLEKAEMSMDINYSLGMGNTSFSSTAQIKVLGQDIYFTLGENPFVSGILGFLSPDEKIEWIKINAGQLKEAQSGLALGKKPSKETDVLELNKQIQLIISKHTSKILLMDKFINKEKVRGAQTFHYAAKLDKAEIKALAREFVDLLLAEMKKSEGYKEEDAAKYKTLASKVVENIVDRLEVKTLEVWIGMKDYQIHKAKFVSNAPSLVSFVSLSANPSLREPAGQDPQKAADIALQNLTFDAEYSLNQEFYDFDKTVEIKAPEKFYDMAKKLKEQSEKMKLPAPPETLP